MTSRRCRTGADLEVHVHRPAAVATRIDGQELRVPRRVGDLVTAQELLAAGRGAPHIGVPTSRIAMPDVDLRARKRAASRTGEPRYIERQAQRHAGPGLAAPRIGPDVGAIERFLEKERAVGLRLASQAGGSRTS